MTNWQERMREIQEIERQRIANQQAQIILEQQAELAIRRQGEQQEERLRIIAQGREAGKRLNFFELLDNLQIKVALEDIRRQVWQNMGSVTDNKTDMERFIRLSFDKRTKIPEIEKKEWTEVVGKGSEHVEFSGWHEYNITEQRNKTRVVKEHEVVRPSYLEVSVDDGHLHVLDTEVALSFDDTFYELAGKIGEPNRTSRTIRYTDINGELFNKGSHSPKESKWDWIIGPETHTTYSIASLHDAYYFNVRLSPELNLIKIGEFINYGLALSCLLRTSQNKLPSQLK